VRQQAAICARKGTSTALKAQAQAGGRLQEILHFNARKWWGQEHSPTEVKIENELPPTEVKIEK
jgi:hypothetical protein